MYVKTFFQKLTMKKPTKPTDSDLVRLTRSFEDLQQELNANNKAIESMDDRRRANMIEKDMIESRLLEQTNQLYRERKVLQARFENVQQLMRQKVGCANENDAATLKVWTSTR